jgi:hypothetical protein
VLIITLILTLTAFSQTDTSKKQTGKTFPISLVKLIIKDLKSGDEAKAQLKLSDSILVETNLKVLFKDNIIYNMKEKEVGYNNIVESQNEKYGVLETYTKKVELDLKKQKVKNKFKTIISSGAIIVLTYLLIIK